MTFIKGNGVELRALDETDEEAKIWTRHVMHSNEHMRFVLTGSQPVKWFDIKTEWKQEREKGAILFGVWVNNRFVGTCGCYNPYPIYNRWEVRFMIVDPRAVGKGLGLEVVKMLTTYGFNRLNAHKLWLGVNAENLVAYKCYLNAGYKVEGTLREDLYVNGKYVDAVRMAILRDEWESTKHSA